MTITSTQQAAEIILQILKQRKTAFRKLHSPKMRKDLLYRDIMVALSLDKIINGDTENWRLREVTKHYSIIRFLITQRRKNTKLKIQQLELHQKANDFLKLNLV